MTQLAIVACLLFYIISEWHKITGRHFFAHKAIKPLQRPREHEGLAKAPFFLAIGIFISLTFFRYEAAFIGIYQVGFCDTLAAVAGRRWGKTPLPFFSRKTFIGSFAFFISALPVALYFLSPSKAILISVVGAFLESLPFKDWDNLTIPVFITFLAEQYFVSF